MKVGFFSQEEKVEHTKHRADSRTLGLSTTQEVNKRTTDQRRHKKKYLGKQGRARRKAGESQKGGGQQQGGEGSSRRCSAVWSSRELKKLQKFFKFFTIFTSLLPHSGAGPKMTQNGSKAALNHCVKL